MSAAAPVSPAKEPAPQLSPAPAGDLWPGLIAGLKGKVPMGEYTFLNNAAMVQGRLDGGMLTLWVQSDFVKDMVGKRSVLDVIEQTASAVTGTPIRCKVAVGTAPAAAPAAPVQAHDNLDDLLAFGQQFDNIIINE